MWVCAIRGTILGKMTLFKRSVDSFSGAYRTRLTTNISEYLPVREYSTNGDSKGARLIQTLIMTCFVEQYALKLG